MTGLEDSIRDTLHERAQRLPIHTDRHGSHIRRPECDALEAAVSDQAWDVAVDAHEHAVRASLAAHTRKVSKA